MRQHTPRFRRLRLDVFPGRHGVTYSVVVRSESGRGFTEKVINRGTLPYPGDVADLDGYDLLQACLDQAERPA